MFSSHRIIRYFELVDEIGQLEPLVDISLAPDTSVRVTVFFEDQSIVKQFRLSMTAADVKQIISKELVGQPARTFDIYHHDVGSHYGQEKMRFLQRSLLSYRVKNDDEIYVNMK